MTELQLVHRHVIETVEEITRDFQQAIIAHHFRPEWLIMRLSGGYFWLAALTAGKVFGYVIIQEPPDGLQLATPLDIRQAIFEQPVEQSEVMRGLAESGFTAEEVEKALDPQGASEPPDEYPVLGKAIVYLDEIMRAKAAMRNN